MPPRCACGRLLALAPRASCRAQDVHRLKQRLLQRAAGDPTDGSGSLGPLDRLAQHLGGALLQSWRVALGAAAAVGLVCVSSKPGRTTTGQRHCLCWAIRHSRPCPVGPGRWYSCPAERMGSVSAPGCRDWQPVPGARPTGLKVFKNLCVSVGSKSRSETVVSGLWVA